MLDKYKNKKIGSYPSPFVSKEEKESKEYGLEYFKRMYQDYKSNTKNNYSDRKRLFEKLRSYAEGVQDVTKYKDLMDVEGDTSYLNIDWSPVAVVSKFVDVIVNGLDNQEYDILCTAIDPIAQEERVEAKNRLIANMLTNPFAEEMSERIGVDLKPKGLVADSSEEIDLHMNINYKQSIEIAAEQGIQFVMQNNSYEEIKKRVLRDLVVIGIGATKNEIDGDKVKIRYVDPANLVTSYSSSPDFKNIQHAGEIYNITISDLRKMAGDQFKEEEYEQIAKQYVGQNNNPMSVSSEKFYDANLGSYAYEYDDFSVTIMDAEFMSVNKMKFEKKENSFGGFGVFEKSINYKPPTESKNRREQMEMDVKVVYSGKYIIGTDYIFDYGLAKNMMRPKSNLSETNLSYVIYQPNVYKMINKSLVDRMMPFADQIQLAHYKIQQLLAKARPKGAAFELGALEGITKGDGTNFSPLDLQEIYNQTGNIYYRRQSDDGNMTNYMPIQELENGIGRDVMSLIQIYQHNLQMIRDVTGVNEARDASQPSSEALVGVQKMALLASNNATRGINTAYLNITKRTAECIMMRLQDLVEYGNDIKGYISAIGETRMKSIELTKDLSLHEFGIGITVAPDDQEQAVLEQSIQISLAQKELRLEDAIMIRSIKNVKLANQLLILRRKKYMEEQMQKAQAQAQAQMQQAQQAKMLDLQAKQQEAQIELQIEQASIQAKTQADAQRLQVEYDLKARLEQQEHQLRMEELKLAAMSRQQGESFKEGKKDLRIDKAAYNQSQMIEQRKDRRVPLINPDPQEAQ